MQFRVASQAFFTSLTLSFRHITWPNSFDFPSKNRDETVQNPTQVNSIFFENLDFGIFESKMRQSILK